MLNIFRTDYFADKFIDSDGNRKNGQIKPNHAIHFLSPTY